MHANAGSRIRTVVAAVALIGVLAMLSACGGKSSNSGTDADRVACASLVSTLKLTAAQTSPAILLANWRTTQHDAGNADDAKLRASIASLTRHAIEGTSADKMDPVYATTRCRHLGSPIPTGVAVSPVPKSN